MIMLLMTLSLGACGRKGPLEPPGTVGAKSAKSATAPAKTNTFFNPNVTPEPLAKDDIDPNNLPLNPQLGVSGVIATPVKQNTRSAAPGIAPIGGGRKAKRILPTQDSFILDPLL